MWLESYLSPAISCRIPGWESESWAPSFFGFGKEAIIAAMSAKTITALILLLAVLFIFISPILSSPKTALRARQMADVLFYVLATLAFVFTGLAFPAVHECREYLQFSDNPSDPLTSSCLLRL